MKPILIETIRKELNAFCGTFFFTNLANLLKLRSGHDMSFLSCKTKKRRESEAKKFKTLLFSFIHGAQCLDDLDDLREDSLFREITGGCASTTVGDWMRSFSSRQIELLSEAHTELAFKLRAMLPKDDRDLIITMDSTPHEQTGKKMEGVAWNYKDMWCLDSQNAYDQYGLSYGFHLRPGNTYSGNGAVSMIEQIFSRAPISMRRFFRADSAYGNMGIYNALINKNVSFVIALKENVYRPLLTKNKEVMKWKKSKMTFFNSTNCEVATVQYPLQGLAMGKKYLRVVFLRAPIESSEQTDLWEGKYRYYALVTNMFEHEKSADGVIAFYRQRANAENFIKEQKYGFDLKHFPCKKLDANRVYGLVGSMAYNIVRFTSFFITKNGCFSKRVRRKLLYIPGQVVKHARRVHIKVQEKHKEVMDKIYNNIFVRFSLVHLNTG